MDKIFEIGKYKKLLKVTKIEGATMEVSPPNRPSKIQTF